MIAVIDTEEKFEQKDKKQEPKLWSYKYEHYRHFEENREAS